MENTNTKEYTYSELIKMSKKRIIIIAGFKNMKALLEDGVMGNTLASKKNIARLIASDKGL
jgi:hypothetical protein